jgi:signal transduction histidine kinase
MADRRPHAAANGVGTAAPNSDSALGVEWSRRGPGRRSGRSCRTGVRPLSTAAARSAVALVAHDLRNPLSTVLLNASALMEQLPEGAAAQVSAAELREQLGWIVRSAEQMNRLIQDLLEVTRIEAGRLRLERLPLSPAALLAEAGALFSALAKEKGLTLSVELASAERLPAVWADRERLQQVFSNLLGNALKFTRPGGWVRVAAEVRAGEGARVCFSVSDSGIGIEPEQLPHLFDPYWQGRRSARGGVGLGLAIARGILEAHASALEVHSTPGHGSTFAFSLPTAGADASLTFPAM